MPEHKPVLLQEVISFLEVRPDGTYVDGTTGGGGHALEIANRIAGHRGRLIALDLDPAALQTAKERLRLHKAQIDLIEGNYKDLKKILERLHIAAVDGVLLDLGFSSLQIDDPQRGFSFQSEAPLDMRYSPDGRLTAQIIVNSYAQGDLIKILRDYGEERWAFRIAAEIVRTRAREPIKTTTQLASVIERAIPKPALRKAYQLGGAHPATRTFQAIRIEVNHELENIKSGLAAAFELLKPGGCLVVITFHSLEDRLVKHFMRDKSTGCICPPDLPVCVCHKTPSAELLGEATPSEKELSENPRSRSARVRALRKL